MSFYFFLLEYGNSEFMATSKVSDSYSLSGISPFLGDTIGETYCAVEKGDWEFDEECFEGISEAAKDFISKLLVYDQK